MSCTKLQIYSGDESWRLSVYPNTPQKDILATIGTVTGVADFVCLAEDGDIVVVSSHLPNNIKLYVQPWNRKQFSNRESSSQSKKRSKRNDNTKDKSNDTGNSNSN